jgi:hypothetical protein
MAALTDLIITALSPGVALTSVIFYNTSLQNRFIYITGRTRELNKEARQLRAEGHAKREKRLKSIEWQVGLLLRRSRIIRRSVLIVYVALLSFIVTILQILALGFFQTHGLELLPVGTFSFGFLMLAVSTVYSGMEMALAQSSIVEDTRNSLEMDEASLEAEAGLSP